MLDHHHGLSHGDQSRGNLFKNGPWEFCGILLSVVTQPAITCSKLTIKTLEQGVKYVQSQQ